MASRQTDKWYIEQARKQYQREGEIEIDDVVGTKMVSRNDVPDSDHGAYVQAWLWVYDPEEEEEND